jgi:xanthine/CO dehydrogenase XdhC/CoxF family maturation factor
MSNRSPWSAYGRQSEPRDGRPEGERDPTFGVAREVMRTQQQLKAYLARTLREYNEIRAGCGGYGRIVAEAMKPPPRPESIEETLRRLSGAAPAPRRGRSDPSSTV